MINQNCPWLVSSLETISTSNAAFSPASPMISLSSTNPYEFDTKQERKMHQTSFYVQQLYIEDTRVTRSGKTWKLSKMTNFHLTAKTDRTCCATLVGFYGHAGPNSWSHTTNKVQQEPLKINSIWPERTQRECGNPSAVTERKHKASHVEPWIKHENTTEKPDRWHEKAPGWFWLWFRPTAADYLLCQRPVPAEQQTFLHLHPIGYWRLSSLSNSNDLQ